MLINWNTQHSKNISSSQIDIQVKHNFYQNLSKIFVARDKISVKFIWESKGTRLAETILKKKNKAGGINSQIDKEIKCGISIQWNTLQ